MSIENGAGVTRSKRTREPFAVAAELLGTVAAVDLDRVDAVGAFVEIGVVAGIPDHPVVAALAECLVVGVAAREDVVLAAAEQEVVAALPEQRVVAGLPEELVGAGAAGEGVVVGAAEQIRCRQRPVCLVEADDVVAPWPKTRISDVLATVGVPPSDRDRAAVHEDLPGCIAADHDRVGAAVTEHGQHAGAERRRRRRARRRAGREGRSHAEDESSEQSAPGCPAVVVTSRVHCFQLLEVSLRLGSGSLVPPTTPRTRVHSRASPPLAERHEKGVSLNPRMEQSHSHRPGLGRELDEDFIDARRVGR